MLRNNLLLGLILLGAGALARAAEPPSVSVRFVPDTILIGDPVILEIDIRKELGQEIELPRFEKDQLTDQIEMLGIEGVDTLRAEGKQVELRVKYRLTCFDSGVHRLTGFPVVYQDGSRRDTLRSGDSLQLVVQTFEIDTLKQTIADIKQPLHKPFEWIEIKDQLLWGGVGVAVLAVAIYFAIRLWRRRKRREAPQHRIPPHVLAIRALEKLHSKKLWQNGRPKEYYSQLADIVRVYIEGRYGVNAMEMTSDQILEALDGFNNARLLDKLRELFRLADLVKFAKFAPDPEENEQAYFDAYFYVEETKETIDAIEEGGPKNA